MSPHRFYRPVWLALEPDRSDLASIEARDWPEGYIGVRRTAVRGATRFMVSIMVDNVWYRSRRYHSAEDATRAYNTMAHHFFGSAARLNPTPGALFAEAEVTRIFQRQLRQIARPVSAMTFRPVTDSAGLH